MGKLSKRGYVAAVICIALGIGLQCLITWTYTHQPSADQDTSKPAQYVNWLYAYGILAPTGTILEALGAGLIFVQAAINMWWRAKANHDLNRGVIER